MQDDKSLLVDFPIECLPTTIRNYVVAVAEHTQTDVVLLQNEIAKNTIHREMLEVDIKKLKSKASKSNDEIFKQELISKTEELQNLSEINYLRLVCSILLLRKSDFVVGLLSDM